MALGGALPTTPIVTEADGVALACEALKEQGAKRVVPLNVAGAFHSPLMAEASESFAEFLAALPFNDAQIPVVLNRTATFEQDANKIK